MISKDTREGEIDCMVTWSSDSVFIRLVQFNFWSCEVYLRWNDCDLVTLCEVKVIFFFFEVLLSKP